MMHLANIHLTAFELNIQKRTDGSKPWHAFYKRPTLGICYWYSSLANSKILGNIHAIFPFMDFPLKESNTVHFNFRAGFGLGFLTKRFDRFTDYKNIAIGSRFNAGINIMYHILFDVSKSISISGGIGITHFSNGAFKMPNLGINLPTANLGLKVKIKEANKKQTDKLSINSEDGQKVKSKNEINVFTAFGVREVYPICGKKYFSCTVAGTFLRKINPKRKIGLGLDFSYNASNVFTLSHDSIFPKNKILVTRPGISFAHELVFSRLSFIVQFGRYLYAMDNSDGMFYDRVGFRFAITNHWFAHLALKTHFAKADYIESGFGYRF